MEILNLLIFFLTLDHSLNYKCCSSLQNGLALMSSSVFVVVHIRVICLLDIRTTRMPIIINTTPRTTASAIAVDLYLESVSDVFMVGSV